MAGWTPGSRVLETLVGRGFPSTLHTQALLGLHPPCSSWGSRAPTESPRKGSVSQTQLILENEYHISPPNLF